MILKPINRSVRILPESKIALLGELAGQYRAAAEKFRHAWKRVKEGGFNAGAMNKAAVVAGNWLMEVHDALERRGYSQESIKDLTDWAQTNTWEDLNFSVEEWLKNKTYFMSPDEPVEDLAKYILSGTA